MVKIDIEERERERAIALDIDLDKNIHCFRNILFIIFVGNYFFKWKMLRNVFQAVNADRLRLR